MSYRWRRLYPWLCTGLRRLSQVSERASQEPGDVHLRDAYPLSHLRLREVIDEAQLEDRLLARRARAGRLG